MQFKKTALNYSGKVLTEFPKEIFTTPRVYKLNLSHNKIKEIPKEIEDLKYLETLDLSRNQIRHLYAKLFQLQNLKILILNNNEVITMPKQIEKLKHLKILNIANNNLSKLPSEILRLQNLEELNLNGNYLNDLPLNSEAFPKLKALWIGQNPLKKLTAHSILSNLPNLKSFYCYSPKMEKPVTSNDPTLFKAAGTKGNFLPHLKTMVKNVNEIDIIPIMPNPNIPTKKGKIFISYAHEDFEYLEKLKRHLKVLQRDAPLDVWEDTKIRSSDKWREEIENALNEASTAILLISTDFLASDFIRDNELPSLLKAAQEKGTRIHPVIIYHCQFLKTKSLSQFEAANSPDEPLSELPFSKQERVWVKLCDDIQFYLEK